MTVILVCLALCVLALVGFMVGTMLMLRNLHHRVLFLEAVVKALLVARTLD